MADERFVINSIPIPYGLDEVLVMNPIKYNYIEDPREFLGFVAQDLESLVPGIVRPPSNPGEKYVTKINELFSVIVSGLKGMKDEVDENEARISDFETRLTTLENRVNFMCDYLEDLFSIKMLPYILAVEVSALTVIASCGTNLVSALPFAIPWVNCEGGNVFENLNRLAQFESDGTTIILPGGSTTDTTIVFSATTSGSDPTRVEVEVQLTGVAFTDIPTAVGSFLPVPATPTVSVVGLLVGMYHWQIRSQSNVGDFTDFISFGTVPEDIFEIDFSIIP